MNYVVTKFDRKSWAAHGTVWHRAVKSALMTGVVVDYGLSEDDKAKVADLGFRILEPVEKHNQHLDVFLTFSKQIQPGESWLYLADPTTPISQDFLSDEVLVCPVLDAEVSVSCILSLRERVKCGNIIKESSNEPYSADIIGGGYYGWNSLVGFFDYLLTARLFDASEEAVELVLNLFSIYFADLVKHGGVLEGEDHDSHNKEVTTG